MRFTPSTDAEIAANSSSFAVWPAGEYDFEVKDAAEKESKNGNEMIELQVTIFDTEGNRSMVFDYLVHTPKAAYKVKHFADATGMEDRYARGEMQAHDCVFKKGRCKVIVKKGERKDDGSFYPDRNSISDYVATATAATAPVTRQRAPVGAGGGDFDDEIPFAMCWQ